MVPPDFVGRDDPGAPNHPSISTRPGGGEVGPLPLPVPPTKAMASAGPQRGRKDGSRRLLWQRLRTPPKAPFSLDSKNRSFSSREKETGFERFPVSRRPLIRRLRRHLPPLGGKVLRSSFLWTFPLPGGRWPEGPDEGALQAWFGAPGSSRPTNSVVYTSYSSQKIFPTLLTFSRERI